MRPAPGIRHYFLVTEGEELPGSVRAAYERASSAGFELACEVEVGRLLAALAAAVPGGGRVLEIGTGVGVGLAWLVHGLGARRDVEVVTVELDDEVQRTALSTSRSSRSSSMMRCSGRRCRRHGRRGFVSSQAMGRRPSAASASLT